MTDEAERVQRLLDNYDRELQLFLGGGRDTRPAFPNWENLFPREHGAQATPEAQAWRASARAEITAAPAPALAPRQTRVYKRGGMRQARARLIQMLRHLAND